MIIAKSFVGVLRRLAPRLGSTGEPVQVGDVVRCRCQQYCDGAELGVILGFDDKKTSAKSDVAVVLWNRNNTHP